MSFEIRSEALELVEVVVRVRGYLVCNQDAKLYAPRRDRSVLDCLVLEMERGRSRHGVREHLALTKWN